MQNVVEAKRNPPEVTLHRHSGLISYPEKWDWREKGLVTGVSNDKEYVYGTLTVRNSAEAGREKKGWKEERGRGIVIGESDRDVDSEEKESK